MGSGVAGSRVVEVMKGIASAPILPWVLLFIPLSWLVTLPSHSFGPRVGTAFKFFLYGLLSPRKTRRSG